MKLTDLIYLTLQNLKNRKSRFFFTILGVAIAIAVVLSLVSFGYGLQASLLKSITTEDALLSLDILPSDPNIIVFDSYAIKKILTINGVDKVSPQANFTGKASHNNVFAEASINVINSDFFALDGKSPMSGKFFEDNTTKKIVVSSLVSQLFNIKNDEMVGKKLNFSFLVPKEKGSSIMEEISIGDDFEIIGVVEGSGNTAEVYLNTKDFPSIIIDRYNLAKVKVLSSSDIPIVREALINAGYLVSSLSDTVDQANKIFGAIQITLGIFGVFALIVAAIGLINTMTISLLERTNEIGIMRAIGASPKDIRWIFLTESTMIGFMGGLSGILLGFVASESLNWGFNLLSQSFGGSYNRLFSYPIWFIFFIIMISTVVGLIGGVWPARRAEKMNPLEALRYK
ncbi:MAG: FtsX-like permease family protein [Candidatus Taylorbacteria bacterium]